MPTSKKVPQWWQWAGARVSEGGVCSRLEAFTYVHKYLGEDTKLVPVAPRRRELAGEASFSLTPLVHGVLCAFIFTKKWIYSWQGTGGHFPGPGSRRRVPFQDQEIKILTAI